MARHDKPEMTPEEARRDHWQMLRFMAINAVVGMVIGIFVAASLMYLDVGGLGTRIARAANPYLATFVLVAPFAFVFGGIVTASAIVTMPYEKKFRD